MRRLRRLPKLTATLLLIPIFLLTLAGLLQIRLPLAPHHVPLTTPVHLAGTFGNLPLPARRQRGNGHERTC